MKLKARRWGLDKVTKELEMLFLSSPYLRGSFYSIWLSMAAEDKQGFLSAVRSTVRRNLLDREFILALSEDIIRKDAEQNITYIDTKSNVYRYLKNRVYKGDLRLMLTEMQSIIDSEDTTPRKVTPTELALQAAEVYSHG